MVCHSSNKIYTNVLVFENNTVSVHQKQTLGIGWEQSGKDGRAEWRSVEILCAAVGGSESEAQDATYS